MKPAETNAARRDTAGRWTRWRAWSSALLPALLLALLAACGGGDRPLYYSGSVMGTSYHVTLVGAADAVAGQAVAGAIRARLDSVDQEMSTYKPDSAVSRFNRRTDTDWFPVSARLLGLVDRARRISEMTGGAFDVTVGGLVDLWGFGPTIAAPGTPDAVRLADVRRRVGFGHLQTRPDPPALRKSVPGLEIDLSAIAKGYAVDQVADYLQGLGVANYLVEVGGELRVAGHNPDGEPWRVAVERPSADRREAYAVIEARDTAVATSGDYRNFFVADGRRYSHAIDPVTGEPIEHDLVSVTVLADDAASADALATGLLVLGPEAGFRVADSEGLAVLLIERHGDRLQPRWTPAFMHAVVGVEGLDSRAATDR